MQLRYHIAMTIFTDTHLRVHLLVSGHVQGVFYRASAQRQAAALGLRGWVRNLADGRVEAVAEGPVAAVRQLVAWSRTGPPNAYVTAVEVTEQPPTGEFTGFAVRYG